MKLKKVMGMGMSMVMALSLAACGGSSSVQETTTAAAETTAESAETKESTSAEGALEGVTLSVGTSGLFAPFSYYDEDGTTLIGFDLDFQQPEESSYPCFSFPGSSGYSLNKIVVSCNRKSLRPWTNVIR